MKPESAQKVFGHRGGVGQGGAIGEYQMLIVMGYMHVDPIDLAEFSADLKHLAIVTRQPRGNISYDAALDDPDAGRLLIAERLTGQDALTAHLHADDTRAFVDRWRVRMWGDIRKYDVLHERELDEA